MIITYYGITCFKIQSGDTILAIDPYNKESGLTPPRFQADIVVSTRPDPLFANTEALTGNPFIITSSGEYEIKNISIEGIAAWDYTLYVMDWEGIRLCHLGALSEKNIPDAIREHIGTVDILFLPVGSGNALDAEGAVHVMNSIDPRIVIPTYFSFPRFTAIPLDPVDAFLKEVGSAPKSEDKFTIKKKEIPQDETKIILLNPVAGK
jgi:L-ascorbate metabolism protein UlaG (beta-lactamase superfamily)